MTRVEIAPERWAAKLDEFTRVHEWALVSIDIWTAGQGKRREVTNLPLLGFGQSSRPGPHGSHVDGMRGRRAHHARRERCDAVAVEQMTNGADSASLLTPRTGPGRSFALPRRRCPKKPRTDLFALDRCGNFPTAQRYSASRRSLALASCKSAASARSGNARVGPRSW